MADPFPFAVSDTTRALIEQLVQRDQHGRAKYGTTLDRSDLSGADWLQHMAEELLDGAGYALAAKRTVEAAQPRQSASLKAMVDRFLNWRLPEDFSPDCGISFTPIPRHPEWTHDTHPIGTNLFTGPQAEAMFAYAMEGAIGDADEDAYVIDRLARLLAEIIIILKGDPPEGVLWSYHDVPDLVKGLKETSARMISDLAAAFVGLYVMGPEASHNGRSFSDIAADLRAAETAAEVRAALDGPVS